VGRAAGEWVSLLASGESGYAPWLWPIDEHQSDGPVSRIRWCANCGRNRIMKLDRLAQSLLAATIALCSGLALTPATQGAGLWNMPTNLRQCFGYGHGPGYHAPMIMGPRITSNVASKSVRRVRHAPKPHHYDQGFGASMTTLPAHAPAYHAPAYSHAQQHYAPLPAGDYYYQGVTQPVVAEPQGAPTVPAVRPKPAPNRQQQEPASPSDRPAAGGPQPESIPLPAPNS